MVVATTQKASLNSYCSSACYISLTS